MAAGRGMVVVCFGFKSACSIWRKIEQTKNIRRSACLKEEVWEKVEGADSPASLDSGGNGRLYLWAPVRDCNGLAA
jgi:hypothetical protein